MLKDAAKTYHFPVGCGFPVNLTTNSTSVPSLTSLSLSFWVNSGDEVASENV